MAAQIPLGSVSLKATAQIQINFDSDSNEISREKVIPHSYGYDQ